MAQVSLPDFVAGLDILNARSSREFVGTRLTNPAMLMEDLVPIWGKSSTLEEIKQAFTLFEEKVCFQGFPARYSPPFWLAHTALQCLYKVLRACMQSATDIETLEEANELLFHLWAELMSAGPGSAHLEMFDIILKGVADPLWRHMATLTGSDLQQVLHSLKTDFVYQEEISSDHYATLMETHIDKIFKRILTAKQFDEAHMGMLDLSLYYLSRMNQVPPHIGPRLSHLCFLISNSYKLENPYLDLDDWVVTRHHLHVIKTVVTDTTFTKASEAQYRAPIMLEKIFQAAVADKMLETVLNDFMSLLTTICNYGNSRSCARLFTAYRVGLFERLELDKAVVPPPMWMFHQCIAAMTTIASTNSMASHIEDVLVVAQELCLLKFTELGWKEVDQWHKLLVNYVVSGRRTLVNQATRLLQNQRLHSNVFAWKVRVKEATMLIDIVADLPKSFLQDDEISTTADTVEAYIAFLLELILQIRRVDLVSAVGPSLQRCVVKSVEKDPPVKASIAQQLLSQEAVDFQDKNFLRELIWVAEKVLKDPDFTWIDDCLAKVIESLLVSCLAAFREMEYIPSEHSTMLIALTMTCLERDMFAVSQAYLEEAPAVYWSMYTWVILPFIRFHQERQTLMTLTPLVDDCLQFLQDCLQQGTNPTMCISLLHWLGTSCPELVADRVTDILHMYLELEAFSQLQSLMACFCTLNKLVVVGRLQDVFDKLGHVSRRGRQDILTFLATLADHFPEVFISNHISALMNMYPMETSLAQKHILHILSQVSLKFPDRMFTHYPMLVDDTKFEAGSLADRAGILGSVAGHSEDYAKSTIDYLMKHVASKDVGVSLVAMETLQPLLADRPQYLVKNKVKLKALYKSSQSPKFKEICQELIPEIPVLKQNKVIARDSKTGATVDKSQPPRTVSKVTVPTVTKRESGKTEVANKKYKSSSTGAKQDSNKTVNKTVPSKTEKQAVAAVPKGTEKQPKQQQQTLAFSSRKTSSSTMAVLVDQSVTKETQEIASKAPTSARSDTGNPGGQIELQGRQPSHGDSVEQASAQSGPSLTDSETVPPKPDSKLHTVSEPVLSGPVSQPSQDTEVQYVGEGPDSKDDDGDGIRTSKDDQMGSSDGQDQSLLKPMPGVFLTEVDSVSEDSTKLARWMQCFCDEMNPSAANDWRMLSSHLGYSNDVIKDWGNQNNPSLSLLRDIYACHESKEASQMLMTALEKMKCQDLLLMVESTLKSADCCAADQDFEYPSPPPVFLSYHWSSQKEAKLLWQHLRLAGYQCWMDEGQMGSGDDLLMKIDERIQSCKVVICCITENYAVSPNCLREAQLSEAHKVPMVPLLLQKTGWPPAGVLGPVFKDKLYIRFYQQAKEKTGDQRYWSLHKFQELLMQLNYLKVLPLQSLISPVYSDWWLKLSKDGEGDETGNVSSLSSDAYPAIFLSYQWGKQPHVKALYRQLMVLGFSCWMDIYRQTSSQSLYSNIAQGIQACRVFVVCWSHKYGLEARCQQELRQATSLNRPIIALVFDKTKWPPSGDMGEILSQTNYFDLTQISGATKKWSGKQFENLLQKLNVYAPAHVVESTEVESSGKEEISVSQRTSKSQQDEFGKVQYSPTEQPAPVYRGDASMPVKSKTEEDLRVSMVTESKFRRSETMPGSDWSGMGYDVKNSRSKSCVLL